MQYGPSTQKPAIRPPDGGLWLEEAAASWARSLDILLRPGAPFSNLISLRRSAACVGSSYTACKPGLLPWSDTTFTFEVPFPGSSPNEYDVVLIFINGSWMLEMLAPTFAPKASGSGCR